MRFILKMREYCVGLRACAFDNDDNRGASGKIRESTISANQFAMQVRKTNDKQNSMMNESSKQMLITQRATVACQRKDEKHTKQKAEPKTKTITRFCCCL